MYRIDPISSSNIKSFLYNFLLIYYLIGSSMHGEQGIIVPPSNIFIDILITQCNQEIVSIINTRYFIWQFFMQILAVSMKQFLLLTKQLLLLEKIRI